MNLENIISSRMILGVRAPSMIALLLLFACAAQTDSITEKSGKKSEAEIVSMENGQISTKTSKIPLDSVSRIVFSSEPLAAKDSGLVFLDGSRLSGIVRKREKDSLVFRSSAFGEMKVPSSLIAGEYFAQGPSAPEKDAKIPMIKTADGRLLTGKILWHDDKSTGIMTGKGLEKIEGGSIDLILFSAPASARKIELRNGDIVNFPVKFDGKKLIFTFNGTNLEISISSLSVLNN